MKNRARNNKSKQEEASKILGLSVDATLESIILRHRELTLRDKAKKDNALLRSIDDAYRLLRMTKYPNFLPAKKPSLFQNMEENFFNISLDILFTKKEICAQYKIGFVPYQKIAQDNGE